MDSLSPPFSPDDPSVAAAVVRLDLSYDGSGFHGWQVQPELRTVQGELMRCLQRLIPLDGIPLFYAAQS